MIPLFNREGTQNILDVEHARQIINLIDEKHLADPATTYQDVQCGTGFIMLVLAERLMETLKPAIPNEVDRLAHIFGNQIFLSDINQTQHRVARANMLRAIGCREFDINVECIDCFNVTRRTTYTISGIDFDTTNEFVPYYKNLSDHVLVVTRANKHSYEGKKINEITTYQFLGLAQTSVPICIMLFDANKKSNGVKFTNGKKSIVIENPTFLPGADLDGYQYGEEVMELKLDGHDVSYGSISRKLAKENPGNVPVIFGAGDKDTTSFGDIIKVSKKIVSADDGYGKNKLVVSKNGNRGQKSVIKYADSSYAVGYTALWFEVKDEDEFKKISKVWDDPSYDKLIRILKETSPANGIEFWKSLPNMKHIKKVKAVYEKHYQSKGN